MLKERRKMQIAAMEGPAYGREGMALGELYALAVCPRHLRERSFLPVARRRM